MNTDYSYCSGVTCSIRKSCKRYLPDPPDTRLQWVWQHTIRGLWIDLLNTLKLRNGVQTGASIACGMMQKNVRKGKEIILLNAKMVDLT